MSAVPVLSGFDGLTARQILHWFAVQAESVQLDILKSKHSEQDRLAHRFPRHSGVVAELAALLLAAHAAGWADEQAFHTSRSISETAAKRIAERRTARCGAYAAHREKVRLWLKKNWGKVMDIRRTGLSWRRVAAMLADEHGIRISHTTLHSYWRAQNADG